MSTSIQLANVPDEFHRRLEARAEATGLSVPDFVLRELEKSLARPSREEILNRLAELPSLQLEPSPAEILREERDRR